MVMGGCTKILLKNILFAANLLLMLCGAVVIGVGAYALVDTQFLPNMFAGNSFTNTTYVCIALGIFIVLVSFLGCCGAVNESRCMLITFFVVLLVLFIALIASAIVMYVFRAKVDQMLRDSVRASVTDYGQKAPVTESWDIAQRKLQCCGISDIDNSSDSYAIWAANKFLQDQEKVVPNSCCKDISSEGAISSCQSNPKTNAYSEDCVNKLEDLIKKHAMLLGGIGIAVACILIIGMVLSCSLAMALKEKK